jgi:hypothetical protein
MEKRSKRKPISSVGARLETERDAVQLKVLGKRIHGKNEGLGEDLPRLQYEGLKNAKPNLRTSR